MASDKQFMGLSIVETDRMRHLDEYRCRLDPAVEELAIAMDSETHHMDDHEIVYLAAAKIKTLKAILIAAGVAEGIVTAVMKEVQ